MIELAICSWSATVICMDPEKMMSAIEISGRLGWSSEAAELEQATFESLDCALTCGPLTNRQMVTKTTICASRQRMAAL
jgi:hypothetical protein